MSAVYRSFGASSTDGLRLSAEQLTLLGTVFGAHALPGVGALGALSQLGQSVAYRSLFARSLLTLDEQGRVRSARDLTTLFAPLLATDRKTTVWISHPTAGSVSATAMHGADRATVISHDVAQQSWFLSSVEIGETLQTLADLVTHDSGFDPSRSNDTEPEFVSLRQWNEGLAGEEASASFSTDLVTDSIEAARTSGMWEAGYATTLDDGTERGEAVAWVLLPLGSAVSVEPIEATSTEVGMVRLAPLPGRELTSIASTFAGRLAAP